MSAMAPVRLITWRSKSSSSTSAIRRSRAISARIVACSGPSVDVSKGTTANSARLRDTSSSASAVVSAGDEVGAARAEAPSRRRVTGAALGPDERHLHGQLEGEPRREHLAEDVAQGVARHVAARALHELTDGRVVADRQRRRVIAAQLAEPARRAGAFVEDRDEPRVDASHLVAQLVCFAQGCVGHASET